MRPAFCVMRNPFAMSPSWFALWSPGGRCDEEVQFRDAGFRRRPHADAFLFVAFGNMKRALAVLALLSGGRFTRLRCAPSCMLPRQFCERETQA